MVTRTDTSSCGTIQGPVPSAQAEKMRLIADIAEAILPLVASVVAPKVERGLVECPEIPERAVLEAFWKDANDQELDATDRAALELMSAPRDLDPEERRQIAADVAADESRKLVCAWLMRLLALSGGGEFPAVMAVCGSAFPPGCGLRQSDCEGFEVLNAHDANEILRRISDLADADAVFSMANVYLVL